jgi:hypothetical protein
MKALNQLKTDSSSHEVAKSMLLMGFLLLLVAARFQPVVAFSSSSSQSVSSTQSYFLSHPPNKAGCFEGNFQTLQWIQVECTFNAVETPFATPNIGGHGTGSGNDIASYTGSTQNYLTVLANLTFTSFTSPETDSQRGSGSYSIQVNTNTWTGTNSKTDEVQFSAQTYQSGYTAIGVWQIVTESQSSCPSGDTWVSPNCYHATQYTPSSTFMPALGSGNQYLVTGEAANGYLETTACGNSSCYDVSTTDSYDLEGSWVNEESNIFGYGSSSEASFTSSTHIDVNVWVTAIYNSPSNWEVYCQSTNSYTSEYNNMNLGSCTQTQESSVKYLLSYVDSI